VPEPGCRAEDGFGSCSSIRSAEHGFGFLRRSAEHGFTLMELMVVIAIIAMTSAAVLLASSQSGSRLSDDAERFGLRVKALRDDAIISARPMAVWVSPGGYGFEERMDARWQPRAQRGFQFSPWKRGTTISGAGIPAESGRLTVNFDTSGLPDQPVRFALRNGDSSVSVEIDGTGDVRVER
jgi:general secretion pathway protein H